MTGALISKIITAAMANCAKARGKLIFLARVAERAAKK